MTEILLIVGLHPHESAAALVAERALEALQARGLPADILRVPPEWTVLGCLDDLPGADVNRCVVPGTKEFDTDLDARVGDKIVAQAYPGRLAFEFHNYAFDHGSGRLAVEPGTAPSAFRIGDVAPGTTGRFEIGFWRNRPAGGIPGKYLMELPAVFAPVGRARRDRRAANLQRLADEGYLAADEHWRRVLNAHMIEEVDVEATRAAGFLDDAVVEKVVRWVSSIAAVDLLERKT